MLKFKDTNKMIGIVPKLYLGFALVVLSVLVVIAFVYKQSLDESNAIKSNNHISQVMTESDTLLTSLLNMETGMRGYSIAGMETFLEPYNEGQRDFKIHVQSIQELTRDNPGQQVKIEQLKQAEQQWADSARANIEKRRSVNANQGSMIDIIEKTQTMQVKGYMDGMRDILNEIYDEEQRLLELQTQALQESAHTARKVAIVGGCMAVIFAGLFAFFIAADYRERRKNADQFQQMNLELQDINASLEEEIMERQMAQEALTGANAHLEERVQERTNELQEMNAALEEEIMERKVAQDALAGANSHLEKRVQERTNELQEMNATLEEEIMERQMAQDALAGANAHLGKRVQERTNELQEMNATLEEEIMERQATEETLQDSRDALLVREQQLQYYADEVVATNTELKSFVNIIAHDFRSPMVNLMGFSTELGQSLDELKQIVHEYESLLPKEVQMKVSDLLEKDVPEAQTFIKSAVTRLSRMVDALLNLSRLGRREIRFEEVDMNKLVNTIMQSYKHQIAEQHIQIEVGVLPKIEIDYLVMEQIIGNLVDNAIKYLDSSRQGKIEASYTENDNDYVVSVKDNGRGIQETDREKIFDLFRRCGNQDQPGEGMGLAYVRTLMRKVGGKVWCESELGVGTKISFTIPKIPPSH